MRIAHEVALNDLNVMQSHLLALVEPAFSDAGDKLEGSEARP